MYPVWVIGGFFVDELSGFAHGCLVFCPVFCSVGVVLDLLEFGGAVSSHLLCPSGCADDGEVVGFGEGEEGFGVFREDSDTGFGDGSGFIELLLGDGDALGGDFCEDDVWVDDGDEFFEEGDAVGFGGSVGAVDHAEDDDLVFSFLVDCFLGGEHDG